MAEIRKAKPEDVPFVAEIISAASAYFRSQGIDQWQRGYPNVESVRKDIADGTGYVLVENGEVTGTCCISFDTDPNYAVIENGNWLNDEPYGVIHRIAVRPDRKGNHLADDFILQARKMAEERSIKNLRADTHADNHSMQRLLERNGFIPCGRVYVGEHEPRIAYQKKC